MDLLIHYKILGLGIRFQVRRSGVEFQLGVVEPVKHPCVKKYRSLTAIAQKLKLTEKDTNDVVAAFYKEEATLTEVLKQIQLETGEIADFLKEYQESQRVFNLPIRLTVFDRNIFCGRCH